MNEQIDLEELERKVYRSYFQDGLWDIFMALLIMGMGLTSLFGIIFVLIWNMGAVVIMGVGKKRITMPRMGIVKFGPKRQANNKKLRIFLGIMVGVNVIVLFLTMAGILHQIPLPGLVMILFLGLTFISLPFFILAYYIDFSRLYYYGLILGFSLFLSDLLYPIVGTPLDGLIVFCSIGIPIFIIGIVLFIRFLKEYPKPEGVRGDSEEKGE